MRNDARKEIDKVDIVDPINYDSIISTNRFDVEHAASAIVGAVSLLRD